MDVLTYALCKKLAAAAVSGITNIEVKNQNLLITTQSGQVLTMEFPTPKDGVSITNVILDKDGSLLVYLSTGEIIDAGFVPAVKGDPGYTPVKGIDYFTTDDIEQIEDSMVEKLETGVVQEIEVKVEKQLDQKIAEEVSSQLTLEFF